MARKREFDEEEVLDRVVETFWRHGYKGTSIELLVEASGLHRSSLYGAFGPKHALYRRALQRYSEQQSERAVLTKGPFVALERWFAHAVRAPGKRPPGCLVVNSLAEYPDLDDELRDLVDTHLGAVRHFFETMTRGLIPANRVSTATDALLGANVAIYTLGRTGAPRAQLKAIAESALDTVRPTA